MALAILETGRWQDAAACLGQDVNTFYPAKGASYGVSRRICASCPVIADCQGLADRAERGQPISHLFGMFVGMFAGEISPKWVHVRFFNAA
jgi:hypothetical protein